MGDDNLERIIHLEAKMQHHREQIAAINLDLETVVSHLRGIQDQMLQVKWSVLGGVVVLAVLSEDSPLGSFIRDFLTSAFA